MSHVEAARIYIQLLQKDGTKMLLLHCLLFSNQNVPRQACFEHIQHNKALCEDIVLSIGQT